MSSTILFFAITILGGAMLLYRTAFKNYNLGDFCLAFAKAGMGCVFVFALPWLIGAFLVALP